MRFVNTYREYPPGPDHDLIVVCNGGPLPTETGVLFSGVGARFFPRSNDGWDIGGYIDTARGPGKDYDCLVCFGESVYFHKPGWLERIVESWDKCGPGMYGCLSSNVIRPHLQTTAFATSPQFLRAYPTPIRSRGDRYTFEHGQFSFWKWLTIQNKPVRLVTWDGCWTPEEWRMPSNIIWKGDQTNCLVWCNHTDNYWKMDSKTRHKWATLANTK